MLIYSDPDAWLKQLQDLLKQAKTAEDVSKLRVEIEQEIFNNQEERQWRKHMSELGNKKWRIRIKRKGDCALMQFPLFIM